MPYWIMFAFLVTQCVAINAQLLTERSTPRLPMWALCAPTLIFLGVFAGLRSPQSDADYGNYIDWFAALGSSVSAHVLISKDPVFQALGVALRLRTDHLVLLMLAIALLSLLMKIRILRSDEYRGLLGFGLLFLISRFFLLHEFTQVRAALGISLATLALVYSVEGKRYLGALTFALAVGSHLSTIVLLPLFVLFGQIGLAWRVLAVGGGVLSLLGMALQAEIQATVLARALPYLGGGYAVADNTLLSVYFIVKLAAVTLLLRRWGRLGRGMRLATAAMAYGIIVTALFLQNDVLSLRLSELTAIFDCICLAYLFARWFARHAVLATTAAVALSATFYFSALKIVHDYGFII
jgi:hypothetical protein